MNKYISEQWLSVVGYEGFYDVSDQGRVRSISRVVPFGCGYRIVPGKILSLVLDDNGRQIATLSKYGASETYLVHRLVLAAFVGKCPDGMEGCHWDGNSSHNWLTNLRWDTHMNNEADKIRHKTNDRSNRKTCPRDHLLELPNLIPSMLPGRSCLACDRAKSATVRARNKGIILDFKLLADCKYKLIMSGQAPVVPAGPALPKDIRDTICIRYRNEKIRQIDLAREYNVSQAVISRVIRGEYDLGHTGLHNL